MRTSEFVLAQTVSLLAVTLILRLSGLSAGVIVLFAIAITVGPLLYLSLKAKKQRELFETQVPDSLLMLANALRAGQGFDQAMKVVLRRLSQPASPGIQQTHSAAKTRDRIETSRCRTWPTA